MQDEWKRANSSSLLIFDNSIGWIKASDFCKQFGYSMKTIYEWHYRPRKNKIPENLIKKFRGRLFLQVAVLKEVIPFDEPAGSRKERR